MKVNLTQLKNVGLADLSKVKKQHMGFWGGLKAGEGRYPLCFGALRVIKLLKPVCLPLQLADAQLWTGGEQSRRFLILPNWNTDIPLRKSKTNMADSNHGWFITVVCCTSTIGLVKTGIFLYACAERKLKHCQKHLVLKTKPRTHHHDAKVLCELSNCCYVVYKVLLYGQCKSRRFPIAVTL